MSAISAPSALIGEPARNPHVADLDGNGVVEALCGSDDGQIEIAVGRHDGVLHVVQTDSTSGIGASVAWNGFRGIPGNLGNGNRDITPTSASLN